MEMKRRGAARVLGVDFDEDYLAQARFAAEIEGLDVEFRQLSVYDVGQPRREASTSCSSSASSTTCATRCWHST